jgi:hypothetical protein
MAVAYRFRPLTMNSPLLKSTVSVPPRALRARSIAGAA